MRIAMLGTRGVPARYGGFETCVEEVGSRLADNGHEVVVYCRARRGEKNSQSYMGMNRVELPAANRRSLETLSHTTLSVFHLLKNRTDVAFVFNAANSILLPAIRAARVPVATHVDGIEWQRSKWSGLGQNYYRIAESLAVRWSDAIISDAAGIADYYRTEFGCTSELISYGAPKVSPTADRLGELGLNQQEFHLVVARFEPENHVKEIVQAYTASAAHLPLVVVGSAPYSDDYTSTVRSSADERVIFLGGVWDQPLLDQLYAHSFTYLHGHSVGGTNPSLLRAIGAGASVIAYDVKFNREVLAETAQYFQSVDGLTSLIAGAEKHPTATRARGKLAFARSHAYDWDEVADRYAHLAHKLLESGPRSHRPTGRRLQVDAGA